MEDFSKRMKINKTIELSVFYMPESSHEVICVDIKSVGGSALGHFSNHMQLTRESATWLRRILKELDTDYPALSQE